LVRVTHESFNLSLPDALPIYISYPDGNTFRLRDPYAFAPTIGELDLHLVGEGSHERLYERLGAHLQEIDGIAGTAFAVWAPNARSEEHTSELQSRGQLVCRLL